MHLMAHQTAAVEKLKNLRAAALFMDMRTGKSRTAMELARPRLINRRARHVMWFCPTDSMETIGEQIELHLPGSSVHLFDDKTKPGKIPCADWHVIGLEGLSQSLRIFECCRELAEGAFGIVDESGMVANHCAVRTRRLMQMSKQMAYRLILDGTPIGNGIEDLYAPISFLSHHILGYWGFKQFAARHLTFSDEPGRKRKVTKRHNIDVVAAKIAPYVFQARREECFDLPPETWSTSHFDMTTQQRRVYTEAKEAILFGPGALEAGDATIYRLFAALQRIACGFMWKLPPDWKPDEEEDEGFESGSPLFADITTNPRALLLREVAGRIEPDRQALVWCKYHGDVDTAAAMLRATYGDDAVQTYDGRVSKADRTTRRQAFQAGGFRFLVLNQQTAARANDFSAASYQIHYSTTFQGRLRRQCEARTQAPTQRHSVAHIDLAARSSIDEIIERCHRHKLNAADTFRRQMASIREIKSKTKAGAALRKMARAI